jgi:ornithine cyclodeaminase/alanine dehydrogenase-like protein (mu-crystallin family)
MIHQPAKEDDVAEAVILTAKDFLELRDTPSGMEGAMKAVEAAVLAQYENRIRQHNVVDRRPGEFEGIRVALSAGDEVLSGMRIFGNPPHTRAYMLFEGETRSILALMDYGVLNSLRVGAIAGVATKYLAPKGTRLLGLLGTGWQAQPQVDAMRNALPNLERIRVFSPTQAHRESFAKQMTSRLEIAVEAVGSTEEALRDADVVDLCAPGHFDDRSPLFDPDWVKPGALIVSMAANQYSADVVRKSRIVSSWEALTQPAPRPPYDELITKGEFSKEHVTPLGAIIQKGIDPRQVASDNVIFHLEGGSAHDLYVATWAFNWAREKGLGMPFDLSEGLDLHL